MQNGAVKAVVRMVQQNVAFANFAEYFCRIKKTQAPQSGVGYRMMGRIAQFRIPFHLKLHQVRQAQQALYGFQFRQIRLELLGNPALHFFGHIRTDLKTGDAGKFAGGEFSGHHADDPSRNNIGFRVFQFRNSPLPGVILGNARYPEKIALQVGSFGKEQTEVERNHLLQRHKPGTVGQRDPPRAVCRHFDAHKTFTFLFGFMNLNSQVQPQIADKGKGMRHIHCKGCQDGFHRFNKIALHLFLLFAAQIRIF